MRTPRNAKLRLAVAGALLLLAGLAAFLPGVARAEDLALVGGTVIPSPTATPIADGAVLIHDGRIAAVGKRGRLKVPAAAEVVDCRGKVITAGFWNSHVHFIEPAWNGAGTAPAAALEEHMQAMLTRWGFTSVFDLGSVQENTQALRRRVESGEVPGPRIRTTGAPLYPKGGFPAYLPEEFRTPEALTPEDGTRMARQRLAEGADGIKVFAGSITRGGIVPMDTAIIRTAADVAHAAGKPVFAHPSNRVGEDNALAGGVDVLAHPSSAEKTFTADELALIKRRHVALTPTLVLFPDEERKDGRTPEVAEAILTAIIAEVRSYFAAGGTILFGTDSQLYDTTGELAAMGRAGMTWRDVLASLTTTPSRFFKSPGIGRVERGMAADLVVLDADPRADVRNLAKVAYTIRAGKVIYREALGEGRP